MGRGYHTREVETLGGIMMDQDENRDLFEEQVEIIFKAFNNERFSHHGKHYTVPPKLPYRGYELEDLTMVPRPARLPVECWQPIVSASPRGLDFMVKHGIQGIVGGGSALLGEGPVVGYRDALARAGVEAELGEGICVGVNFHLADSREQAVREATPFYEEHAKMFAPLGFFRGLSDEQMAAVTGRGGWDDVGFPNIDWQMKSRSWFCGDRRRSDRLSARARGAVPGARDGERAVEHGHAGSGDGRAARALRGGGHAGVRGPARGARAAFRGIAGQGTGQRTGQKSGAGGRVERRPGPGLGSERPKSAPAAVEARPHGDRQTRTRERRPRDDRRRTR